MIKTDEIIREGVLSHRENSPTAASAGNRLFPESGVQTYRVLVRSGYGVVPVDVEAATGDHAAELALAQYPGGLALNVTPAPQRAPTANEMLGVIEGDD